MADIADIANDLMQLRLDQQLAARPAAVLMLANECEYCGDPIPAERLKALVGRGCLRCIDCQRLLERAGGGR